MNKPLATIMEIAAIATMPLINLCLPFLVVVALSTAAVPNGIAALLVAASSASFIVLVLPVVILMRFHGWCGRVKLVFTRVNFASAVKRNCEIVNACFGLASHDSGGAVSSLTTNFLWCSFVVRRVQFPVVYRCGSAIVFCRGWGYCY